MTLNIERSVSWTTLLGAIVAGALRFGAVETDVKAASAKVEKVDAKLENVNTRVEARFEVVRAEKLITEERLVSQVHSLDKNVAVLAEEVRQLRLQLERTRK